MLDITKSPDFKRVGDKHDSGYYDISLFNNSEEYECKGTYAMDQALENILLTIPGERLFNLAFGSPLYKILFSKNVNQDEIRNKVFQQMEDLLNITIDRSTGGLGQTDDPHILAIHFKYSTRDGAITNHEFTRRFSK
jgi:hypothetical protein